MTECEIPIWLTREFVQKAIENGNKLYEVTVESFDVDNPVPAGNNYGSDIFGVKAKYRKSNDLNNLHEISLILKGQVNGELSELCEEIGAADKEGMAYTELAPKLKSLLGSEQNHDDDNILPNSYFSIVPNVIILEDLKRKGYEMVDKIQQLDYDYTVEAIKALAKFHAGSIIIQQNDPQLIEKLSTEVMFTTQLEGVFREIMKTNFSIIAKECEKRPRLKKYSKWFEKNFDSVWENIATVAKAKENELNVLVHGNYWLTNMMFKKSENERPKVKILDLQTLRYSSPVLDFIELVDASVQEDVRVKKFNQLIQIYLQSLNSLLEQKGCSKRLSEEEFKKSIADRSYYRIFVTVFELPFVLADPKEVKILDRKEFSMEILGDMEKTPMKDYMKGKYMDITSKRLEEFEKIGLITAE